MEIYKNLSIESLPNEEWRDIVGYEGLYQVSNLGRVKSLRRNKLLSPRVGSKGYLSVALCKDGGFDSQRIHRLVYCAFIGDIPINMELDHINTIKVDNSLSNLRLVTHKENMNNPLTRKTLSGKVGNLSPNYGKKLSLETRAKISAFLLSDKNPRRGNPLSKEHRENISKANKGKPLPQCAIDKKSKAIIQMSLDGEFIKEWKSGTVIQRELGYSKSNICNCCKGKLKHIYGYKWRYKDGN